MVRDISHIDLGSAIFGEKCIFCLGGGSHHESCPKYFDDSSREKIEWANGFADGRMNRTPQIDSSFYQLGWNVGREQSRPDDLSQI